MIDLAEVRNAAGVAAREGLTRARVCQLLRLLSLAPVVLADLEDVEGTGSVPSEAKLRKLAGLKTPERQVAEYDRLCAVEAGSQRTAGSRRKARPPRRGLQHLFERARRYHAMLESGEAQSLEGVGRIEGITGRRVTQIVSLLQLAPEIIEVVDVPADQLPVGMSERKLRQVVRWRDHERQLRLWTSLLHPATDRDTA